MVEFLTRDELSVRASDFVEMGTDLAVTGTGVTLGMIGAKFIGDTVEAIVTPSPIVATSTLGQKALAWGSNNLPKVVGAFLLTKLKTGHDEMDKLLTGGVYGVAGSVVVDTYGRAKNAGVPTPVLDPSTQHRLETLNKENQALKSAVKRLGQPPQEYANPNVGTPSPMIEAQPKRPMDEEYEFADQYMKRPIEEGFEFADPSMPEVMAAGFGFVGI